MFHLTRRTVLIATAELVVLQTVAACSGSGSDTPAVDGTDSTGRSAPSRRARSRRPSRVCARRGGLRTACAALLVAAVTGCGTAQGGMLGLHMAPRTAGAAPASGAPRTPGAPSHGAVPSPLPTGSASGSVKATPPAAPAKPAALVQTTAHGGRTVALTFDDGPGPASA
ncbi:hypothetical protein ACFWOG_36735, partial [Kitasatospora sp. NPDC058406]